MILAGRSADRDIFLRPWNNSILVWGLSEGGESTLIAGLMEQLRDKKYQICLFDPEGDYSELPGFVVTGDADHEPSFDHLARYLDDPEAQTAVNLTGVGLKERAKVFGSALMLIKERRGRDGRPHWLVIDEAHHMLPRDGAAVPYEIPERSANVIMVTVHPEHVAPAALKGINTLVVVGRDPGSSFAEFAKAAGKQAPPVPAEDLPTGEALVWFPDSESAPVRITAIRSGVELQRHKRKYAEGELEQSRMFTFRGPEGKLNLRARNLLMFIDLANGVDDETWVFHLGQHDYSRWFDEAIRDRELADEACAIESDGGHSPAGSRREIITSIERRYTGAT